MEDQDLIHQIKNGNANAFRFLVSKYEKLVFGIVWRIMGNDSDLEDIAQDVFMKVYRGLGKFRGDAKLSTWIASIAWKTSADYLRRRSRGQIFQDTLPEVSDVSDWMVSSVQQEVDANDLKRVLQESIEQLPVHYKTVLTLFYLEEFSCAEIEKITDMPAGTIKSYLNRARKLLRNELAKRFPVDICDMTLKEAL